jgi:Na+/H+ antiporter NhaD/arsenite permease-like protein
MSFSVLPQSYHSFAANTVFILVYAFLLTERVPKVVVALLGATLLILLGVLSQTEAFAFIDLNVIFLLVGMMILVNIVKDTGAFDWLGLSLARFSGRYQHSGLMLFTLLVASTAVFSALLDNVTTVLFMASITCALCERLKISPVPFLMGEVIFSNIGGTSTLIGDPPNIMIASAAKLNFVDFLLHTLPVVLLILPAAWLFLILVYRRQLQFSEATREALVALSTEGLIRNTRLLKQSVVVLSFVLLGFVLHHVLHYEVGTIALAGAAVLMLLEGPKEIWNDLEWDTIFFFIGLFMIVGALEKVGTLHDVAQHLIAVTNGDFTTLTLGLLWFSGVASAIVDNIPFTATMIPIIHELVKVVPDITPLWWALSLGACLGGNGTLIGATANVLVADMVANRFGQAQTIRFGHFLLVGGGVAILSLLISTAYVWCRYLM